VNGVLRQVMADALDQAIGEFLKPETKEGVIYDLISEYQPTPFTPIMVKSFKSAIDFSRALILDHYRGAKEVDSVTLVGDFGHHPYLFDFDDTLSQLVAINTWRLEFYQYTPQLASEDDLSYFEFAEKPSSLTVEKVNYLKGKYPQGTKIQGIDYDLYIIDDRFYAFGAA